MPAKKLTFVFLLLTLSISLTSAQELLPCGEREFIVEFPRVVDQTGCLELPILSDAPDAQTNTSIEAGHDGTLYATNPHRGEVIAYVDTDGDLLPDTEQLIADNLHYPNGIEFYNNTLYVIGDGVIYTITDDGVTTLVDDLPGGRGFLAKGILVHDNQLYAGIPSPCDFCAGDDPLHGTVIRMNLDGTEREVIARGLRYPAGLAIYQDNLWVTDISRDVYSQPIAYDEINRINLNDTTIPHFGFPYCAGRDNVPDLESDFDCATATAPDITLASNTRPIALYANTGGNSFLTGDRLLVAGMGSVTSGSLIPGNVVFSVEVTDSIYRFEVLVPADSIALTTPTIWEQSDGHRVVLANSSSVNDQGGGIYPHYVYDIVVSDEGWLYFSVGGKGIYVIRPR